MICRLQYPIALCFLLLGSLASARAGQDVDGAFDRVMAEARAEAARGCTSPSDLLVKILCFDHARFGVRRSYPQFGAMVHRKEARFEIDVANSIATRLGGS